MQSLYSVTAAKNRQYQRIDQYEGIRHVHGLGYNVIPAIRKSTR